MDQDTFADVLLDAVAPFVPLAVGLLGLVIVFLAPMPGRGPGLMRKRDPWRTFKFALRRQVMDRAQQRCEAPTFLLWGRCGQTATDADHIYPWSKGGPTVASNGQALCRGHNRRKSNLTPPWWYVRGLERRRRSYFEPGEQVTIRARMSDEERLDRRGR